MFDSYGEWWAVKTKPGPRGIWMGPSLVTIDGDNLAWDGGPSGFTVSNWDDVELIKQYENDYEIDSVEWMDRVEEIRNQFEKDFPPEETLKISAGWLSPHGKFYPCSYTEHLDLAYRLAIIYYDSSEGDKALEDNDWAKVCTDGLVFKFKNYEYSNEYTQAQIDTLGDLYVLAKKEDREGYAEKIQREIESIKEIT